MQKTIGGDRLGSGSKMTVELHNYGRSTHNLSRAWRSSMTPGTLIPFMVEPALNGDTFDIDIAGLVRTAPTLGPLFGSFKMQMDIFVAPMRLYNKQLHNNKLGIGMEMHKVIFPKLALSANPKNGNHLNPNAQQINQSSIFAYLGIRGLGKVADENTATSNARRFDAQPFLAYWDIYKNYYANKQETNGYAVGAQLKINSPIHVYQVTSSSIKYWKRNDDNRIILLPSGSTWSTRTIWIYTAQNILDQTQFLENVYICKTYDITNTIGGQTIKYSLKELLDSGAITVNQQTLYMSITFTSTNNPFIAAGSSVTLEDQTNEQSELVEPTMRPFALKNIDDMRENILSAPNNVPFTIGGDTPEPYNIGLNLLTPVNSQNYAIRSIVGELSGIGIKTYQSDRFNNWLSTEWIDGANGISEITKIDTSQGLKIDALNLAQKVYNMLNRIAVSGGSYHDWQEAVYGEIVNPIPETPWFAGGTSQEITFQEVTSTSENPQFDSPLGTLASKGYSQHNSKHIHINIVEPSFIIGIASITPRIDYSQGNKWFINLNTMDDLHKPALDGIGFQELITDEMHAFSTISNEYPNPETFKSAGKQPSWIHYMTSQNECYANFAMPNNQMYMTLNRNFETDPEGNITDLTTYIDPQKFNSNFARTDLGAQNFWVQLGLDVIARRKMSAKQIPNL